MLEDSQLQIMRLGESNIRQFEDSDLQILGFRYSKMEMSRDWRSNKMLKETRGVLQKLLRLCSRGPKMASVPKQHFFPKQQSICYALSLHKVYKLVGPAGGG